MATTPIPRSYSDILGDMISAFLSKTGLRSLKIGSPCLSFLESGAQSDLRSADTIFTLLDSISLDNSEGEALIRLGADEDLALLPESPASGAVSVIDTGFTKISGKILQSTPAPIIGSTVINLASAIGWPSTGSIYLGRGTANYEGPLAYTSILAPGIGMGYSGGNYWSLVLSVGTQRYHNVGESIILAQGGNRVVGANAVVQTAQGNINQSVLYRILYGATIPDGETQIDGVLVVAVQPGLSGNVLDGAIKEFVSPPFNGAICTNPLPFSNGRAVEDQESFRERIRNTRASRSKGTPLAIQTGALGITAPDEAATVLSASLITHLNEPSVLYIDDGTGYEEKFSGIAIETFFASATGGEIYAKVSAPKPIAKAPVVASETAPYQLVSGMMLTVEVAGTATAHTFDSSSFRNIGNASAFEVVSSINSDPGLGWTAKTFDNGTRFFITAKADTNESIQVVASDNDANDILQLPITQVQTMFLYQDDRLLTKDGLSAQVRSNSFSEWGVLGPGSEDLALQVDGTPLANLVSGTYTFTAQDFIDAQTGFSTLARNSIQAWAKVLNYRIPGITATSLNGRLYITSNKGLSDTAKLTVVGGSLTAKGMFVAGATSTGADSDYTLDRNTGEIKLKSPLPAGSTLAAGSASTRAFTQTDAFATVSLVDDGHIWVSSDSNAAIVPTGVTASIALNFTGASTSWGARETVSQATGTGMFTNVQVGDWVILWDPSTPAQLLDLCFRIEFVAANGSAIEFALDDTVNAGPVTFAVSGLVVVRSANQLQRVTIPAADNYTAASLTPIFNTDLVGAKASVYKTRRLRLRTNTFDLEAGDIAVVAADIDGKRIGLTLEDAIQNSIGHLASTEAGNPENGTPNFVELVNTDSSGIGVDYASNWTDSMIPDASAIMYGLKPIDDGSELADSRRSSAEAWASPILSYNDDGGGIYSFTPRTISPISIQNDRWYLGHSYAIRPEDELGVLLDQDEGSKRFIIGFNRGISPTNSSYGTSNVFVDATNGGQSLAVAWGYGSQSFDFTDFAVYMAARGKTHDIGVNSTYVGGSISNTARTLLWRYNRLGAEGNWATIEYVVPSAPNQGVQQTWATDATTKTIISISLASGALRTGFNLPAAYPMGLASLAGTAGLVRLYYILGWKVVKAEIASNVMKLTFDMPAGLTSTGLDVTGGTTYYLNSTNPTYPTGNYVLTAQSESVPASGIFDTVSMALVAANAGPVTANIGAMYLAASTTADFGGGSPAVAQGDFVHVDSLTTLSTQFKNRNIRIANNMASNSLYIMAVDKNWTGGYQSTPLYNSVVGDPSKFQIFINSAQTAATIAAAVNALPNTIAKATVIGTGAGIIERSSAEDINSATSGKALEDGLNFIQAQTNPATLVDNYTFDFKLPVSSLLASNNDWQNEDIELVPRTAKNMVDWLNQPTVSGLSANGEVSLSRAGRRFQIASYTPGSAGSVEVQGGTSNSVTAAVKGSATVIGTAISATIETQDVPGFDAGAWVSIDNTSVLPRNQLPTTTVLNSITHVGTNSRLTISGSGAAWWTSHGNEDAIYQIEKQGQFVCLIALADPAYVPAEGDWVRLRSPVSASFVGQTGYELVEDLNAGNAGLFKVVRAVGRSIWIENESAIAQTQAEIEIFYIGAGSTLPGDILSINTSAWDGSASNKGLWTVVDVGDDFSEVDVISVTGAMSTVGSAKPALGAENVKIRQLEGTPSRLIKRILTIAPVSGSGTDSAMLFDTVAAVNSIGEGAGSVVTALDKFAFPLNIALGVDGYKYNTGLLSELNRVLYGVPSDTATYPGIVAAGAQVNTNGPTIKRVQITIAIRLNTGADAEDTAALVRAAVAAVINSSPVGIAIPLSALTDAADSVGGVFSSVMVSPVSTADADLISIQPMEKARVLDLEQDILVVYIGT